MTGITVAPIDHHAFGGSVTPTRTSQDIKVCSAGRRLPRDHAARAGTSPDGSATAKPKSGQRPASQDSWFP